MPEREPSGGSELNETERVDKEYVFGMWSFQKDISPTQVVDADGAQFTTADDDQYVDFSSQLMCSNLGYPTDAVIDTVEEQMRKAAYISPGYTTDARAKLGKKFTEVTPGDLSKAFFSTSGTETVEAAIKIARFYTGKQKIVSRYRSYHSATYGSISVTGDPHRLPAESGISGTIKAPDPCVYGSALDPMESVEYIDEMLELEGDTVVAILVELIVGSNGILVPPNEYLSRLKEIAYDHGMLPICDEVMSGSGRTGEWFGCDVSDVEPDIMTMAKGLTGAHQLLGATIVTSEIAEHFKENMFCHGHTYSGHPATVIADLATIETYQKENLIDRANEMGGYVSERIEGLAVDHPSVGETYGVGLFRSIELLRRANERTPFGTCSDKISSGSTAVDEVAITAKENGAYVANTVSTLIIASPLTITKDEVDTAIDALNAELAVSDAAMDQPRRTDTAFS